MLDLNPAIKKRVSIVAKSKEIHLPFLGFFKKSTSKVDVNFFFKKSENLEKLPGSQQIMALLKFDKVFKIEKKELKDLIDFYQEYDILKKEN